MIVGLTPTAARIAGPVRLALLAVVGLLLAHDAVYLVHFGAGHDYAEAMSAGGHDGYWLPWTLVGLAAGTVLAAGAWLRLRRLGRLVGVPTAGRVVLPSGGRVVRRRPTAIAPVEPPTRPSYLSELAMLWAGLWSLVSIGYLVQENLEGLLADGRLAGFAPLAGPETRLAVPILALITLLLAAAGALVRWRINHLRLRIARRARAGASRSADLAPPPEWRHVGALAPHRWILSRPDAGRAPPAVAST